MTVYMEAPGDGCPSAGGASVTAMGACPAVGVLVSGGPPVTVIRMCPAVGALVSRRAARDGHTRVPGDGCSSAGGASVAAMWTRLAVARGDSNFGQNLI